MNTVKKLLHIFVLTISNCIFYAVTAYASGNPWEALEGEDLRTTDTNVVMFSESVYRIFQRIGIYGCIITTIIFLITLALRWGDPRVKSEAKSKIIWKFAICFLICATTFILSLVLEIIKDTLGY